MSSKNRIRVFEHQRLKKGDVVDDVEFTDKHFQALEKYYGDKGCDYFSLIHNGVKFNQFVGVLQVGNLTIEVLPKADNIEENGVDKKDLWHAFLIDMLRKAGILDVATTGFASLRLKSNSIFHLYLELFLKETSYLFHRGLIKKYRKIDGNLLAMKGSIVFPKQLAYNTTHAERFFVRYTTYDRNNLFNQILYKTLRLIRNINTSPLLQSDIESLFIDFPECKDVTASDALFDKIVFDRKTEAYKKAINMARLLLLNYHPDIRRGGYDVLALMFDMNKLWEVYVFKLLKKELGNDLRCRDQVKTDFWEPKNGRIKKIIPDIMVSDFNDRAIAIVDTKWKNQHGSSPADDDLKQMFTYNIYKDCLNSTLVYPGSKVDLVEGTFVINKFGNCSLTLVELKNNNGKMEPNLDPLVLWIKKKYSEMPTSIITKHATQ